MAPLIDRLGPWAPPVAWCGLILVATSVPLPTEDLSSPGLPLDVVGHLVMYFGLGWTVGRALLRSGRGGAAAASAAWLGGLAFAALDEGHQAWVPTRVPSTADWIADGVGLTVGLALVMVVSRLRSGTAGGAGRTRTTREGAGDGDGAWRHEERGERETRDGKEPGSDD